MKIACIAGALAALACSAVAHAVPAEDAQHAFSVMNVDGESSFKLEPNDALELTVDDDELEFATTGNYPRGPRMPRVVIPLLQNLKKDTMQSFLSDFTSFWNRYHDGPDGLEAAEFLYDQVADLVDKSEHNVTLRRFEHSWEQFSIIARFEPMGYLPPTPGSNDSAVILCAHLDSSNPRNVYQRSPGADMGGSGTATILEVFRVLTQSTIIYPTRPVEFHWYSAFDGGSLGSQDVAEYYKANNIQVYAMMETERTGLLRQRYDSWIGISNTFSNPELVAFTKHLVARYVPSVSIEYFGCVNSCGDHKSWNSTGFPIVNAVEQPSYIRSPGSASDQIYYLDFTRMLAIAGLALSFAVELGLAA